MAPKVRIWLLGGFRAEIDGRAVADEAWRRNKARAVVKLLAMAAGRRLHREQLMDALWPDLPPAAAAANLRKAVHFARQALGPERLRLRDGVLRLDPDGLWIDVDAFEAAADGGDVAGAIALHAGELLPEDRFEPWTEERRERLRSRLARLLLDRADELRRDGDAAGAAAVLERLAAADPLDERAVVVLMRAYATAGQRHLALAAYRQLHTRLAGELGVEPTQATRRLRDEIAAGRFPGDDPAPAGGGAPAPAPVTAEERKLVTVVAVDTAAPGADDPERSRAALDGWAGVVTEALRCWGGTAEPLLGGSVLAVFGMPRAHEDDPVRALRAALEIVERSALPVRVGVGTGEVIAPSGPGAAPRAVAGEALRAAVRLREAAGAGTVLATARTCEAVAGRFRFGAPVDLDAGGAVVRARRLVGPGRGAEADAPRLHGPMVGRDADVAVILNLFDDTVRSAAPRLLTVFGPAGVGKSRLVAEAVAAMVSRHPGATVLRGRCLAAGRGIGWWALGEIVREACGVALGDRVAAARAALRDGLTAILSRAPSGDLDATVFALAEIAGVGLPGSPLDRLEPKLVADELARAWPRFTTACAAAGPALLVVEDLHWAGDQLLQMLELVVARSTGPLLVLATARPELAELSPGFGFGGEGFASISLRPLGVADSRALLDSLAPAGRLAPGRRDEVLAKAEGNPLFLEELVLHLAGGRAGTLPDTLHSLLAARIDALPAAQKRVLQEAAVVGRVFWEAPVERALGEPVAAHLVELERRGFVLRRPASTLPAQAELAFRHALIHDVAYASVPMARRARAHAGVGAWLEELAGGRRDELAELLADHFAAAAGDGADLAWGPADRERVRSVAIGHLLRAGAAARRRFAVPRAVALHEQALSLAATDSERAGALEELGDDHESAFHGDAAYGRYLAALEIARADPGRAAERARLCRKLASLIGATPGAFRSPVDPTLAEGFVREGLAAAGDEVSRAWLLVAHGSCARLWRGSEPFGQGTRPDPVPVAERIAGVEAARAVAEAERLPDLAAAADDALFVLYGLAGRYADVVALVRHELDALPRARSRLEQADVLRRVAVQCIDIGARFDEGLGFARRAHALSVDTNPHQLMHATWPLLAALYHLGRWPELPPFLDQHVAAFEQDPAVECQLVRDGPFIGATMLLHLGDRERADALAKLAGDRAGDLERASAWQARFATASGDPATARRISEAKARQGRLYGPQHALALVEALETLADWGAVAEVLPVARENVPGNALLAPFCDRAEGLVHAHAGDADAARAALRRAVDGFERLAVPFEAARTRERLADVAAPPEEAAALLRTAMATYARLHAAPREAAVRARQRRFQSR
jgi:DNA-binding SARP family transcriptional activator